MSLPESKAMKSPNKAVIKVKQVSEEDKALEKKVPMTSVTLRSALKK
jgi:hypothetical protein